MVMQDEQTSETIEAAARVIEEAQLVEDVKKDELLLSSGLVLRIKGVPPFLIQRAASSIPKPPVPKILIEEKGRTEDNPNDPAYLEALSEWEVKVITTASNILLAAGTSVVTLPEGMHPVESDEWIDVIEFFGIEFDRDNKTSRYLTWLSCYALSNAADLAAATTAVGRRTGVSELEVSAAVDSFRTRARRRATNDVPPKDT